MTGLHCSPEIDEAAASFQKDGVVVLRQVFGPWMEPLRAGIEALMADPSPLERTVKPKDGSAPFFQDLCNWQRIAEFRAFVLDWSRQKGLIAPGDRIVGIRGSWSDDPTHNEIVVLEVR